MGESAYWNARRKVEASIEMENLDDCPPWLVVHALRIDSVKRAIEALIAGRGKQAKMQVDVSRRGFAMTRAGLSILIDRAGDLETTVKQLADTYMNALTTLNTEVPDGDGD